MRIVVNGWFWNQMTAGSGQYLDALAAVLPRAGAEHDFILALPRYHKSARSLPSGWRPVSINTPLARFSSNLAKVWFEQVAFPGLCRRLGADVAFVPYWGSPWIQPCPVVVTVHDLIPLLLPEYRGGALQKVYTQLVSATARRATAVITDSEASRKDIIENLRVPDVWVHAIHLAAHGCVEAVGSQADSCVRARLDIPDGPFLLYLGGFDVRKNVSRTLQGYAKLVRRCNDEGITAPALVVAGKLPGVDSPFAPDPRPIIRSLGLQDYVHLTGWVDEADKAILYRRAAGVLFVSEYEGFGLPVLEAMACEADTVPT